GPLARTHRDVTGRDRLGGGLEQRGVDDPAERPRGLVDQLAAAADLEPGGTQERARALDRAGSEEDAVARLGTHVGGQPGPLGVAEVLGHRAAELTVLADEDVGQTLGAALLGPLLPGVELPP